MSTSFIVNLADLSKILDQIKIAERHAAGEQLIDIIGQDNTLLPQGLRTVDGSYNHLLPGQYRTGAADELFPRLLAADFRSFEPTANPADGDTMSFGPGAPVVTNNNYALPGDVADADPRTISNLVVDQTVNNPAAIEAWFANPIAVDTWLAAHPGKNPVAPGAIVDPGVDVEITNADLAVIPNQSPDIGLSPSNSGWMTLFGQFFDHGLDLVTKGGNGTVYIPLEADDPLIAGADGIFGNGDDLPAHLRFMAVTRATTFNGTETENTTTPFVDQNQTYTSSASHQVFLREYTTVNGQTVATGKLLNGAHGGIANWGEVKAQAASMLGIALSDFDVHNVPELRTDPYGKFIPGPNGYAQIIIGVGGDNILNTDDDIVVEGNPLAPVSPEAVGAMRTGHAFLNDIAHHAAPSLVDVDHDGIAETRQVADTDPGVGDDHNSLTYDDEMLNAHFVTGDGRGNENIGLTAVHTIFHSEHNRLVDENKATIIASGDLAFINEWLLVDLPVGTALPPAGDRAAIDAFAAGLAWDGERLFQAARFVTEMQYQHLVFEEFARRLQPNVDPFVFTNSADLDPAIVAEFAHTVYRFGHSMLTDTVDRLDNDLTLVNSNGASSDASQIGLIEAFLNPQAFTASAGTLSAVSDEVATGAIIRGMSRQVGNEIDEFVVEALRNNLLGLPLDLPAINIARGRDTGIPSLNDARSQLFAMTGDAQVKPYTSWLDFAQNIKHPTSVINFIAAYGKHTALMRADVDTLEEQRAVATALVLGGDVTINGGTTTLTAAVDFADRLAFLNSTGPWTAGELRPQRRRPVDRRPGRGDHGVRRHAGLHLQLRLRIPDGAPAERRPVLLPEPYPGHEPAQPARAQHVHRPDHAQYRSR